METDLSLQFVIHYFLHLGMPLIIARLFAPTNWQRTYLILLATMLVDLDHLLANPIFAADRCSIHFHPLHTYYAIILYALMLFLPGFWRWLAIGLLLHMATDLLDCWMTFRSCSSCLQDAPALPLLERLSYTAN